jgi:hypothetical protein
MHSLIQDLFYYLSDEENLIKFLKEPEKYCGATLPEHLPRLANKEEIRFPQTLALKGYCPVTLKEGPVG